MPISRATHADPCLVAHLAACTCSFALAPSSGLTYLTHSDSGDEIVTSDDEVTVSNDHEDEDIACYDVDILDTYNRALD